jgi:hypothetical protein
MAKSLKPPEQQAETEVPQATAPAPSPYPPGFNPVTQARKLHEAMDGFGTDERAIFDVLRSGRADLNRAIETEFNRMNSKTLRHWLGSELSGSDYTKAIQLLGRGDFTLTEKLNQAADGWGTDEEKIFRALEIATPSELAEVKANAQLMNRLREELNDNDYRLAIAYLDGRGALAAKLRRAMGGWGTDESAIWRALDKASATERTFVLEQPSLMKHLKSDLSERDFGRAQRMLNGSWDNADKIEVSVKGWGTDEALLLGALSALTAAEYQKVVRGSESLPNGIQSLNACLKSELSGDTEFQALEILHQKQLAFDPDYAAKYRQSQSKKMGEAAMTEEGASALVAGEGQSMSVVAQLKKACMGWGTDESSIWDVCAGISAAQGQWIRENNPDNVMGLLRSELNTREYFRVRSALGGGALGRIHVLRNAIDGLGTNEDQIYAAMDAILAEGVQQEILSDRSIMSQLRNDLGAKMHQVFVGVLTRGTFAPIDRLRWATVRFGTDELLLWEVCAEHGQQWYAGGAIQPDVLAIIEAELSTGDGWKAKDLIRGEPTTEQGRLERAKELLERQRSSGVSVALMDAVSSKGGNADEAWRDYQVTYNQAYEDGQVSESEKERLRDAEDHSKYTTEQFSEAKATFAQWASQIAVTIVGIVATVLTAGAMAGPLIAALSANASTIGASMVAAAALKVGIHKAIEGEGYDLNSVDALVDGVGAAIEGALFVVGNIGAAKMMQGLSKTKFAASVGPSVEQAFGGAGKRILAGGLEGSIDGTIGGIGDGLFRGLASDEAWRGDLGHAFSHVGATTLLHTGMAGVVGFGGGAMFRSLGETFGPAVRKRLGTGTEAEKPPMSGSVDDIMLRMPDDLKASSFNQKRLTEAAFETNRRMQKVADDVSSEFGLPSTKVGLKGNKVGVESIDEIDQDGFIAKVMEKTQRHGEPRSIDSMTDMSRGRFDVDTFEEATAIAQSMEARFTREFGWDNIKVKRPRDVYKRYHILVRDPETGISHEWQIGTKSLSKFIEGAKVKLPGGVELHGNDFHVVMYDVLAKLNNPDVRVQHGLPDRILDDIGLSGIQRRYDALMVEAGTVKKGASQPDNFDARLDGLAEELAGALRKLEDNHPGLASKLDTKLAAEKAAQVHAKAGQVDGPVSQPDMPERLGTDGTGGAKGQDLPQPKVRPEHEGSVEYREYKNAVAFLADGKVDPHAAKQGALGDCYLLAGCAAEARANPAGVRKLIQDNGDGTFDVTLYMRDSWYRPPRPKVVRIDASFPSQGSTPKYAKLGRADGDETEIWMALFEKALAQETGSYDLISGGNINKMVNFGGVHELLTGNKVSYLKTADVDPDRLLSRMASALDNKEPISAGTYNFKDDAAAAKIAEKMNIYANHAYAVESVNVDAGTVSLQNPWGSMHPKDVPIADFQRFYQRLDIGKAAPSTGGQ